MTSAANYDYQSNYYTDFNGVKLYVDNINSRLKILDYKCINEEVILGIIDLAKREGLGKIISNCRIRLLKPFRNCGFTIEGIINGFFQGEDAYCISFFTDPQRKDSMHKAEEDSIIHSCISNCGQYIPNQRTEYQVRDAAVSDIPQMVKLFSEVFETYPSPIFSMEYLKKVMGERVLFKVAVDSNKLISIASADMDLVNMNAEITDCATYPKYRGKNILSNLIFKLESDLKKKGFHTLYSLSRAINPGINKVLCKHSYRYCGRLVNNCHICGGFEDMNIWIKRLKK